MFQRTVLMLRGNPVRGNKGCGLVCKTVNEPVLIIFQSSPPCQTILIYSRNYQSLTHHVEVVLYILGTSYYIARLLSDIVYKSYDLEKYKTCFNLTYSRHTLFPIYTLGYFLPFHFSSEIPKAIDHLFRLKLLL